MIRIDTAPFSWILQFWEVKYDRQAKFTIKDRVGFVSRAGAEADFSLAEG